MVVSRGFSSQLTLTLLIGSLALGASACIPKGMVRSATRDGMKPILSNGIDGFVQEPDLMIAEGAIASNLKLIEGVALTYPDEPAFKLMAAMARANYAFGFLQDELQAVRFAFPGDEALSESLAERALQSYRIGRAHAEAVLLANDDFAGALNGKSLEAAELSEVEAALATLEAEDAPALFWLAFNWGGTLIVRLDVAQATQLPKIEKMVERALELDETFFYGIGPHLMMGTLLGFRSPALGGRPDEAAKHFDRAKELGGGALLPDVLKAELVYGQTEKQEAFESTLEMVISSTVSPDHALLDALAQRRACRLYANMDQLFLADPKPVPRRCLGIPQKHPLREPE